MIKIIMKKFIMFVLGFITIFGVVLQFPHIYAINVEDNPINKAYCSATIEDGFSDNIIYIVLSESATFSFKEYTPFDFLDIGEVMVEELTAESSQIVT